MKNTNPNTMMINDTRLRQRNMNAEYSQPGSCSFETINGRQTPEMPNENISKCDAYCLNLSNVEDLFVYMCKQ